MDRRHHCLSVNGSSFKKQMRDHKSFIEFCMGVPVTTQRLSAFNAWAALDIWALGFLMMCPSSRTTRSHLTVSSGDLPCGDTESKIEVRSKTCKNKCVHDCKTAQNSAPHPLVATSTEQPPAKGAISGTSLFLFTSGVTITKLLKISSEKCLITKIVRLAVECFLSWEKMRWLGWKPDYPKHMHSQWKIKCSDSFQNVSFFLFSITKELSVMQGTETPRTYCNRHTLENSDAKVW